MAMIQISNLQKKFGEKTAVNIDNYLINQGDMLGLVGNNGAGKTTVFNLLTSVYQPTRGTILLDGLDTAHMTTTQANKAGIARTFQNIRLFGNLTVFENVLIAKHMHAKGGFLAATFHLNGKEETRMRREAMELLEIVGLAELKDETASNLPYGQQRRLEIARALATDPRLLILDEPAAGMNPQETVELTEFIREIREQFDLSILLIEHHMNLVMGISDRIYVLEFGKLIAEGIPEAVQMDQRVIDAYLGVDLDA